MGPYVQLLGRTGFFAMGLANVLLTILLATMVIAASQIVQGNVVASLTAAGEFAGVILIRNV